MGALVQLACVVAPDEAVGQHAVQLIVYQCMEHHLVYKGRRLHEPLFRLKDIEGVERSRPVAAIQQDAGQFFGTGQSVCLILSAAAFLPLALPGVQVSVIQHLKRADFFKVH